MREAGLDRREYDWIFVPKFALERLHSMEACRGDVQREGRAHWLARLDAEAAYMEDEGIDMDYAAIGRRWLSDPGRSPVVAILDQDEMACVVDGVRHTALAHVAGRRTVPVILGTPLRTRNPVEFYLDVPPTEPLDVPWADELLDQLRVALEDPQIRMILGPEVSRLVFRLETAPRREKYFERVSRSAIEPVEFSGAEEGWFMDSISGRHVVLEDDPVLTGEGGPYWVRETVFPEGAITIGELVRLESLLWSAAEKAAELAEDGLLTPSQREAAVELVEAADHLSLRNRMESLHADPETAERIKRTALDIIAYGHPRPREANRKGFSERPHDWNEILVSSPEIELTRGELRNIYEKNANKIVDAMRGHDAIVLIGIGKNRTILRRKAPDGTNIRITKAKGIDDPHALEYWANRRLVELHRVIGAKTNVIWVDIDPKGDGELRKFVGDVVPQVEAVIRSVYPKAAIVSWDSGKRGVHVEGYLPSRVSTDAARRKLRKALQHSFAGNPQITTGIAKVGQVRLDLTTLKRTGSLRAPWTPAVTGRIKRPLRTRREK